MKPFRLIKLLPLLLFLAPLLSGADLSTYRGFQLGMRVDAAVKYSGMDGSEVTVAQVRPARIQELNWHPARFQLGDSDAVEKVLFSFYNGELFRITVDYDVQKTEGLTVADMVKALSAQYGSAMTLAAKTVFPSTTFSEGVAVAARWEDADCSINLVQNPYGSGFGLIAFSKRLDMLAQTAIATRAQLDEQEAPQRAKAKEQSAQSALDKARLVNIGHFRP